jgi:hypothetical protein
VQPAFLSVLGARKPVLPAPADDATSTGRRRAFAEWVASPENPLTARVMVNRIWQHHFGRGLVGTSNDFGTRGEAPSHPELLDWLAAEFMHGAGSESRCWDVKGLVRLILTSATYRQTSHASHTPAQASGVAPEPPLLLTSDGATFSLRGGGFHSFNYSTSMLGLNLQNKKFLEKFYLSFVLS